MPRGEQVTLRIGGEFESSPADFLAAPLGLRAQDYGRKHHLLLDTGRSALLVALRHIVAKRGIRRAWLPRYCCESVLLPFRELGFEVGYYGMGGDLQSPDRLPDRLQGSVFLFIHYFGKRNDAILRWLESRRGEDFVTIEDCVQAGLNENVGATGDFVINSHRKFLPQPDGALLACDIPIEADLAEPDEAFICSKLVGKMMRESGGAPESFLPILESGEERLRHLLPRRISWLSSYLLERTDLAQVRSRRQSNCERLRSALVGDGLAGAELQLLFERFAPGETPLGLPVLVPGGKRDELRRYLCSQQIFCPVHWPLPEPAPGWESELELSRSMLTLPIDQRLGDRHLDYMLESLKRYFKGGVHG